MIDTQNWLEWFDDDDLVCDCEECRPHDANTPDPESCNCPSCTARHISTEDLQLFFDPKGFIKSKLEVQPHRLSS